MDGRRAAAILAVLVLPLAGCGGSSSSDKPTSPAQQLAELQRGHSVRASDPLVVTIRRHLDALAGKCRESRQKLAGEVYNSYTDLRKNKAPESMGSVIKHLDTVVPDRLGKVDCASFFAAYLVLREKG